MGAKSFAVLEGMLSFDMDSPLCASTNFLGKGGLQEE